MNDDYLWDKSGEPDPEIEHLEELLGELRYRRPAGGLPLPQPAPVNQPRMFTPALAAAAALLFVMLAAGLWFALGVRTQGGVSLMSAVNESFRRASDSPTTEGMPVKPEQANVEEVNKPAGDGLVARDTPRTNGPRRATHLKRREQTAEAQTASLSSLRRREQINYDEGVAAREQLIKALHLASSKLNLVQKKVQDNKSIGPVS